MSIAKAIIKAHSNVKSVFAQLGGVHGDFRLRELRHVLGVNSTFTVHREYGCAFEVDVEKCYFSPRLSNERMRVCRLVQSKDVVLNMFTGVGCFSIITAKHSDPNKVYSVDINPEAVKYMKENIRINGAYGKVIPILGNAKDIVEDDLQHSVDRVIMPLPEKAFEYLPTAILG